MNDPNKLIELLTTAPNIAAAGRHKSVPAAREMRRAQQRQQKAKDKPQPQRKGFR